MYGVIKSVNYQWFNEGSLLQGHMRVVDIHIKNEVLEMQVFSGPVSNLFRYPYTQ